MTTFRLTADVATLGLAIGLVFSLVCYLTTNLSPGGMITPGWIALTLLQEYQQVFLIAATTVVTFGATKVLERVVILYGKRLFASVVLISVLLQTAVFLVIQRDFPLLWTYQTLGFIVPGLVAYQLVRQPVLPTLLATGIVVTASYAMLIGGIFAGFVTLG